MKVMVRLIGEAREDTPPAPRLRRVALIAFFLTAGIAEGAGRLSGTVKALDGTPLLSMHVEAYTADGFLSSATTSGGMGAFALSLPSGSYRLLAFDPSGVFAGEFYREAQSFDTSTTIALSDCTTLDGVDFALARAGVFTGSARDAAILATLPGLTAVVYNLDGTVRLSAATGAFGEFRLAVPPGTYKIGVYDSSRRYAPVFYAGTGGTDRFDAASPLTVSASQTFPALAISLSPATVVAGTVRAAASGTVLSGVVVELYDVGGTARTRAATSSNGTYSVVATPGTYKIVASDPAHSYRSSFYRDARSFDAAPSFDLSAGATLGGVDLALDSAFVSTTSEVFVVAAANAAGANGTYFTTELFCLNPSALETAVAELTWLPSGGGDNTGASSVSRSISPGAQLDVQNVVAGLFGTSGGGAIRIVSTAPLAIFTRTSTPAGASAPGGTYGLGIPGQSRADSLMRGRLAALAVNAAFRTNVGFLNPGRDPLTISLRLTDGAGTTLASGTVSLQGFGHLQANTIASYLGISAEIQDASLEMWAPAPFFAYATLIDQKTGDSAFVAAKPD
jgi:hypothetical protein